MKSLVSRSWLQDHASDQKGPGIIRTWNDQRPYISHDPNKEKATPDQKGFQFREAEGFRDPHVCHLPRVCFGDHKQQSNISPDSLNLAEPNTGKGPGKYSPRISLRWRNTLVGRQQHPNDAGHIPHGVPDPIRPMDMG